VSSSQSGSDLGESAVVSVTEASQVGEARRACAAFTSRLGWDETTSGEAALIVTEAAGNLVKHGGGGILLLRELQGDGRRGLEFLALDKGPGMTDPDQCLRDGFSTAGTPGTGLGAVRRMADEFDIYTATGCGVALLARLWPRGGAQQSSSRSVQAGAVQVGAVSAAKAGEPICGDSWAWERRARQDVLLVADGLGHGPQAADAAREAVRLFRAHAALDPLEILQRIHAALRSTRGAAVAIAVLDHDSHSLRYVGVGNISATILAGGETRSAVSFGGTVGHQLRKMQEFVYPFPARAMLVMHSDGMATSWHLDAYPGLVMRDPSLVAGVLYRDFQRGRDDVTVVAARAQD